MKALRRLMLTLIVTTIAGMPAGPRIIGAAGRDIPPAIVETYGHLTVLRLRGTPYEMGYQHGAAQREIIRQWVKEKVYDRMILGDTQAHGVLLIHARQLERKLPPEMRRELRGIADGAGLPYEDLLLLNLALNHLLPLSAPSIALPPPPVLELQPLAFAAPGEPQTGTLLGYRLDAPAQADALRRHLLAVIYQPADGLAYVTLTWSGQVGAWCGLNEARLAICATPAENGESGDSEYPPAILTRQLLAHAQNGEQALRQAIRLHESAAFHLLVVDGRRQHAISIRFDPHRYKIVESEAELLTVGSGQAHLTALLDSQLGRLNRDKALAALSRKTSPEENMPGTCGESTLLNALFVPASGQLWVGLGLWPASCRRYLDLRLTG